MDVRYSCPYVTVRRKAPDYEERSIAIQLRLFFLAFENFPEFGMTLTNKPHIRHGIASDLPGRIIVAIQCCR